MKRVLFILLCICLPFVAGKSFAQRYLPGQKGIQLTLGGVDDFGSNVKHLHGNFQVGLALSRYNRNHSRWLFGADYVKKHYSYKDVAIPKAQFTGEVGYFVPFISDRGKNVFFSAGLSALAGYETTNWNCKLLYDSVSSTFSISSNSMEQGNWNVDEMLHWLDMKINREDRNIREQSKKMNENFLHFFEWNAESLYKSHFMSGCYKILRQAVDGAKGMDTVWNIVEDNIAYCENKLLNGQVDCNSSSRTTNVAHFLKLECMQQLVRDYREFANILAQTPPEENLQQTANKTEKKREEPPERKIKTGIRR